MTVTDFESILVKEGIPYETQVCLKKKTWIHRGGIAVLFVTPRNVLELERVMSLLYANKIKHLVVGSTSNIYILNTTNIPVVLSTLKCNSFRIENSILECDCGVQVKNLARNMIESGVKGFEYLTQLPGTVGAAVCNNSSVKNEDNSITNRLIDFDIITPSGLYTMTKDDLHLSFRTSDLKTHILKGTILRVRLKAERGNVERMKQAARENETERLRLLEGPAQNLGCTVHKPFINGKMPSRYRIPLALYSMCLDLFDKDEMEKKRLKKNFVLRVSGYSHLIPYVSDKLIITYIWRDEKADEYFEDYLNFMNSVYKTDQIEIEVIK